MVIFTAHKQSFRQGNVFTSVCLFTGVSAYRRESVSLGIGHCCSPKKRYINASG